MNISEFRKTPFNDKAAVITYDATYLAHRVFGSCNDKTHVFLYHHNNFFIEMYFSDARQKILFINAFQGMCGLEPYFETISIDELNEVI